MNKTLEDLKSRRSIRKYKPDPVAKEDLDTVLEIATYGPTAKGSQRVCIVAVTDKAVRDQLSAMNAAVMGASSDPFYGAPAVCVIFGDGSWDHGQRDGSAVLTTMLNAAYAVGLGSCWINRAYEMFKTEEGLALMKAWGVPDGYEGVGCCILGYPDGEHPVPIARKEDYIIRVE